jgi:glycosyltransferase involved in cell wall biosynthesis
MRPSVGCVTISFNQARFLRECIESITCADPADLSHVVVDPGSTDGSREIIGEYARGGRFSSVILEADRGPGDGLNKGFSRLQHCDILCYVNSDDRLVPGAIDWARSWFARHPKADVLMGAAAIIDEQGAPRFRKRLSTPFSAARFLSGTAWVMQPSTFFRRSAFAATQGFNPDNRSCWDTELIIDMLIRGARFNPVTKLLGESRFYPGTISHSLAGNVNQRYSDDMARLREKLVSSGAERISSFEAFIRRWSFRLNPIRRFSEAFVR